MPVDREDPAILAFEQFVKDNKFAVNLKRKDNGMYERDTYHMALGWQDAWYERETEVAALREALATADRRFKALHAHLDIIDNLSM